MDEVAQGIERLYRERYVRFRNGVATVTGSYDTARDRGDQLLQDEVPLDRISTGA